MKFELWSVWHILYIISPFIAFGMIYLLVSKRSERVKNTVGILLGAVSVLILIVRNVDIFLRSGWDVEVIPLQVCHIGSLIAGLALIFKKKWLIATSFCFNMLPAILAMVFASSLANYETLLRIRPQTYVWGHFFIVVCALYGIFILLPKLTRRDLLYSVGFVGTMSVAAIICNSLFRVTLGWEPNYFYLYNYKGTPLKFLYEVFPTSQYGWFSINWFYTVTLFAFFIAVFIGLFFVAGLIVKVHASKIEQN